MNWKTAAAYTALVTIAIACMATFAIIHHITDPLADVLRPYKTAMHMLTPAERIAMDGYFKGRVTVTRLFYVGEGCLVVAMCVGVFWARRWTSEGRR